MPNASPTDSLYLEKQQALSLTNHEIVHTQRQTSIDQDVKVFPNSDLTATALEAEESYYRRYPNRWSYIRETYLRDAASEFFGTMLLVL